MKSLIPFLYVALLFVSCSGNKQISSELNRYVDPFIGTTYTGHTFPGATYPWGWYNLVLRPGVLVGIIVPDIVMRIP